MKDDTKYDCVRLDHQLCFPLYAASKEIIRRYKPILDELDLTYTQYIVMMVLWEERELNVKELGERLYLDSGTLTPVLKKLENKEYLKRERSRQDERNLLVSVTDKGMALQDKALSIPEKMMCFFKLPHDDADKLYHILYELLHNMQ